MRDALAARADALGLDPARVRLSYVLNWGGFVNQSFHVTDGQRRLHLKLADEAESVEGLRRWRGVHILLEERYHAPPMRDWLDVPGTPLQGPVFEHLSGAPPERLSPAVLAEIAPVLHRLHADGDLAARLGPEDAGTPARDTFLRTYARRMEEDLRFIGRAPPPFVTPPLLEWMRREADALEAHVRASAAFAEPVRSPIHGDLWLDNLLVAEDGRWWVLDWDDLALGDPALDWTMLLGPSRREPRPVAADDALRTRLPVYARASLLDWVVDPLSDWIGADAAPEHAEAVRAEKQRIHQAALAAYRELYPAPLK